MVEDTITWLLASDEPWTRYRTRIDLLGQSDDDTEVRHCQGQMQAHPQVRHLVEHASSWQSAAPLTRHNDAAHPIYAISTLADFGLRVDDPEVRRLISSVLAHQGSDGAFLTPLNIPMRYGGSGEAVWSWMLCDTPTLLYSLLSFGFRNEATDRAAQHLLSKVSDNGWRCISAAELGGFRGPGRKDDFCPIATLGTLKALSLLPTLHNTSQVGKGIEALLWHWEHQKERKVYLFGIGTDFRRLKYPFVWYDILHVTDVLSRYPAALADTRFQDMVEVVIEQSDGNGRFTASSMYRSWKGWSFADKKQTSPWLTLLAMRVQRRMEKYHSITC